MIVKAVGIYMGIDIRRKDRKLIIGDVLTQGGAYARDHNWFKVTPDMKKNLRSIGGLKLGNHIQFEANLAYISSGKELRLNLMMNVKKIDLKEYLLFRQNETRSALRLEEKTLKENFPRISNNAKNKMKSEAKSPINLDNKTFSDLYFKRCSNLLKNQVKTLPAPSTNYRYYKTIESSKLERYKSDLIRPILSEDIMFNKLLEKIANGNYNKDYFFGELEKFPEYDRKLLHEGSLLENKKEVLIMFLNLASIVLSFEKFAEISFLFSSWNKSFKDTLSKHVPELFIDMMLNARLGKKYMIKSGSELNARRDQWNSNLKKYEPRRSKLHVKFRDIVKAALQYYGCYDIDYYACTTIVDIILSTVKNPKIKSEIIDLINATLKREDLNSSFRHETPQSNLI
ncbi:MAG: hypothetical protein ACTSRI_13530 [Promethearchaeota archaeon]